MTQDRRPKATKSLKTAEISRSWYVVDASQAPLGRVATVVAQYLTGKHKATFTPHIDNGDYVIVINAEKTILTGRKAEQKTYYRHSGYIGGIKQRRFEEVMERRPETVIEKAVRGMLPRNKLHGARMLRLKVYSGSEHEHQAQKPQAIDLKGKK